MNVSHSLSSRMSFPIHLVLKFPSFTQFYNVLPLFYLSNNTKTTVRNRMLKFVGLVCPSL